ncbi:MAG: DEDD exonuclease domain-containing protein [Bacteroidota bacterium]|nr:DEDD exonuclease domain-containing protein [Bacteroidota bacterium]
MQVRDATFVIVDLETTGTHAVHDRIIEIGAVKMRSGDVVDTLETLVDPQCTISRHITRITGITNEDVFDRPQIEEVLPQFLDFLGNAIFVAHYCQFDSSFIDAELQRAGLPPLSNPTLCTLRLARRLLPGLPSKGLSSLITFFDLDPGQRHRALSDANATQQVLTRLLYRLEEQYEITEVDALLAFQHSRYKGIHRNQGQQAHIRKKILRELPHAPGVYRMIGAGDKLLYIGKARVLSDRVRSYYAGVEGHPPHVRKMMQKVQDIQWTETVTELEALLLESRLIKEHAPPFNRAGRKYRRRPFLRLGAIAGSDWITVIEHVRADGARHYGPLANRREAELLAEALVMLYGTSPSSFKNPERVGVGLGSARIGGRLTEEGFAQATAFLQGENSEALAILERRMEHAAKIQAYERAARIRNWLVAMQTIHSRPHFTRVALLERSGAVLFRNEDKIEVHFVVNGCPTIHRVWPCAEDIFREALVEFQDRMFQPQDRLKMQQVDAASLLSAWMFKNRDQIHVLSWAAEKSFSEFQRDLQSLLEELHAK